MAEALRIVRLSRSNEDAIQLLQAAIALYRKRGYSFCERYNDNPQATVFPRKQIAPEA